MCEPSQHWNRAPESSEPNQRQRLKCHSVFGHCCYCHCDTEDQSTSVQFSGGVSVNSESGTAVFFLTLPLTASPRGREGESCNIPGFIFFPTCKIGSFHDYWLINRELIRNRNIKTHHLGVSGTWVVYTSWIVYLMGKGNP